MVTVQVQNLINFVAEVFAHSDSSPEEARRHRDVPHDRKSYGPRQPRRDPVPGLYQVEEDGLRRADQTSSSSSIRRRWRW